MEENVNVMEEVTGETVPKRKKGVLNTAEYKREVVKRARVKNIPYTDWKGKERAAKEHGEDCR